jgi:BirA family transcriptional regulator, biotin operon repressor / biotin---[acetyl-CoA-carboxylase] ligase
VSGFLARQEQFAVVGSTNDVVRGWLAEGTPEVCLAVADEQTAGRGRAGRTWVAPAGGALLLSLGFRPTWLAPDGVWRLAATASLGMAEAAEHVAALPAGTIRLKWPNDLVVETTDGVRKLAGVLGETDGLGGPDPRAVIGIGLNTNWALADFPPELVGSMTSLSEAGNGPTDHRKLLEAYLARLELGIHALRAGMFDEAGWASRQVTTGRWVRLEFPDGNAAELPAIGVDARSGALVVINPAVPDVHEHVLVGEVRHVRLASTIASGV